MINTHSDPEDLRTQKITKEAYEIYTSEIYPNDESIMCKIHDSFHKEGGKAHNCIGCNFSDFTQLLQSSLANYQTVSTPLEAFTSIVLYAYLLVERFEEIFKIVGLPEPYKKRHFQVFGKIKRWTNFFKHPKAFILVHHPEYLFENDVKMEDGDKEKVLIINQEFVDTYYAGDANNNKLYGLLTNKKDVWVYLPHLGDFITEFCTAQKKFIDIISNNEVFREILDGKTTLKDYFENEGIDGGTVENQISPK